jgi:hypothetical protein
VLLRRAVPLLVLIALLVAPVAAWAGPLSGARQSDGDGTLSILRGRGTVDLQATGAVIAKIRKGKVKVKIYKGKHRNGKTSHGQVIIRMRGKGTVRHKQDGTTIYKGKNIRVRIVDQKFRLQINGVGVHLSAVAQGTCTLQAAQTAADPGVFSLNGNAYQPLPQDLTVYQLSAS